ncbi:MAG: hypothetical protein AUI33_05610 [Ignavibacteria bacterium 13_1_40CM_2_61_4]|nr:MAG: hypothetical protein AUI33_05610 [Ignavibacteria bacterium 13_1_40CM_2_61_4]
MAPARRFRLSIPPPAFSETGEYLCPKLRRFFVIQGWDINAAGIGCCNANGTAEIDIEQANASFIVRNVYLHA